MKKLLAVFVFTFTTSANAMIHDQFVLDESAAFGPQVAYGSHTVKGHYRSNGTWVNSYRRTNPDGKCWNNYGGC